MQPHPFCCLVRIIIAHAQKLVDIFRGYLGEEISCCAFSKSLHQKPIMGDYKGPLWLLMVALAVCNVYSLPGGPPLGVNFDNVCNALRPNPSSSHGSGTPGNGGYRLQMSPSMTPATNGFTYQVDTNYTSEQLKTLILVLRYYLHSSYCWRHNPGVFGSS